ncbi:MAG: hypothetical protein COT88_00465 [Candidatus Colwellbacteria bacterium CG10_big_fil_rev_8_21_14_0_10_41_28]|uniref:Uncharacterized protein n=1 Tax=Candidatus Colwellbacteria bacterium CG10_big_fil_rev_8_21_14_0_10_41_28 TaxID=1974539 RepID=A0A2H0VHP4_9BACT|nr:MAG: hypothetical protein COT88_00465 [Candidatus Colwellbacteria bacterium CG10_big_fil_rev_8_21_14_0_10_41_28]
MTTIINTPPRDSHSSGEGMGAGMILGIVVTVAVALVFFYMYGWPVIMGSNSPEAPEANVEITIPAPAE